MYVLRILNTPDIRWLRLTTNHQTYREVEEHDQASHFFTLGGAGAVAAVTGAPVEIATCPCTGPPPMLARSNSRRP